MRHLNAESQSGVFPAAAYLRNNSLKINQIAMNMRYDSASSCVVPFKFGSFQR
jgi:hypothetical protein